MLNDALKYLKLGWSIIPACWPAGDKCGCGRGHRDNSIGKAPLLPTWKDYQSRLPTTTEVTQWWTDAPLANIACITGEISGLVVVDLEYDGLTEGVRLALHSGLISLTGKGRHLFYRHPGGKVCNAVAMNGIKGFDLRADGGYVMLPGSRHVTGRVYRWLNPVFGAAALPLFPAATFAISAKPNSNGTAGASFTAKPEGWIADALNGLSNGNRNNTLASVVGKLHGQRWAASDIRALLIPHALRVQFPENELDTIIRSITSYPVTLSGRAGLPADGTGSQLAPAPKLTVRTFAGDWADYERRKAGLKSSDCATGYPRFDALIGGGLQREELLTVAAWTGVGKTNWLLGACKQLCASGKRVLLLSTEMSYRKIWDRYIALCGSEEEARKHQLIVCDEFIPDSTAIKEAIAEYKPDVFVFDHIHNVSEEHAEVGQFMKGLKEIALAHRIPGIVAAQFNKNADWTDDKGNRVPPRMSMIKGASAIIQVSAQILLLDERDDTPDQKDILGALDKNRDGEKGLVSFVLKKHPYRMIEA